MIGGAFADRLIVAEDFQQFVARSSEIASGRETTSIVCSHTAFRISAFCLFPQCPGAHTLVT